MRNPALHRIPTYSLECLKTSRRCRKPKPLYTFPKCFVNYGVCFTQRLCKWFMACFTQRLCKRLSEILIRNKSDKYNNSRIENYEVICTRTRM